MSKKYLTVYNLQHEKDWVLKNAFDIIETREINTVWELEFTIPKNDQDIEHCQPYWYVRYGDDGQMYRFTEKIKTNANESTVTYHCEHVIATLSDDVMFQGPYFEGGIGHFTAEVLGDILKKQTPKNGVCNWILGICQPRRQFEYSWENENLLAALFSVPNCFGTPYMWTYDTSTYPWKVNLVNINEGADPDFYLMAKKNILRSEESSSNLEICTRLYGLGEGEGVNQLTIKSVNDDSPYIQSSPEKIAEYGIVSRIFVDRRYQYPETLKARMESLLKELENPIMQRTFEIVDLYDLSPDDMYKAEVGDVVLLKDDNTKVFITKTEKNYSVAGDMKITIATKAIDMASSIADLADRQRIEQVYSQGASQVYSFSFFGNATSEYPLEGFVYFPEDLKYLNEVKLKVMLRPFRSYSKSALSNGGQNTTINIETRDANVVADEGGEIIVKTEKSDPIPLTVKKADKTKTTASISTDSSAGGSQDGNTGNTTGGGTINVDISGTAVNTSDANWTSSGDPYTAAHLMDSMTIQGAGNHTHSVTINDGNTMLTTTPLDDPDPDEDGDNYSHRHYFGAEENDVGYAYGGTSEQQNHSHKITGAGHMHKIHRIDLRHNHKVDINVNSNVSGQSGFEHSHSFKIASHTHKIDHSHTIDISHTHSLTIPGHQHTIQIPGHSHKVSVPGQDIPITIEPHSHEIEAGIFEKGNPKKAIIMIDDDQNKQFAFSGTDAEIDITRYLLKGGSVPRGQWIKISVKPNDPAPNDLAYISVFGNTFAFIQSYTGGNF